MALLSARQAAKLLGLSKETTRRKAAQAVAKGEVNVAKAVNGYQATEEWWRAQFPEKPRPGRKKGVPQPDQNTAPRRPRALPRTPAHSRALPRTLEPPTDR